MKLQDICLAEAIDITKSVPINFKGRKFLPVSGDIVGQGIQSRVQQTSLGVVTKSALISPSAGMHDPSIEFLKLILNHQDNPFFPKIYHAKIYKDSTGDMDHMVMIIQMEKLVPLTSSKIKDTAVQLFKQLGFGKWENDIYELPLELEKLIFSATHNQLETFLDKSRNPKFKEAVQVIVPYIKKQDAGDLHVGNWMLRLTGHGPQLVIIDPFAPMTFLNYDELVKHHNSTK